MGRFYRLRGRNGRESFLIEALLIAMKRVRNVVIRIARYEAMPDVVSMDDKAIENNIWKGCLAGKVAYCILTGGFSPMKKSETSGIPALDE